MATTSERTREQGLACCSFEAGKTCRKGPSISRSILGGFVGTVAITMMMYVVAPMMLGHPMDIAKMLGSMLGDNWWAGIVMHFANGTVIFPLLTYIVPPHWMFGWASAPYDPDWRRRFPHRAAWMALAGPVANLTLGIFAGVAIRGGIALGYFHPPTTASFTHVTEAAVPGLAGFAAIFFSILFVLNVLLGTFNLLPIPPLDGHTGITLLMSERAALRFLDWSHFQGLGFAGLLLAWAVYGKFFEPIFRFCLAALYPGSHWG